MANHGGHTFGGNKFGGNTFGGNTYGGAQFGASASPQQLPVSSQSPLTQSLLSHPLYQSTGGDPYTTAQMLAQALQQYGDKSGGGGASPTGQFNMGGPYNQLGGRAGGYSSVGDLLSNATKGGAGQFSGPQIAGAQGSANLSPEDLQYLQQMFGQ